VTRLSIRSDALSAPIGSRGATRDRPGELGLGAPWHRTKSPTALSTILPKQGVLPRLRGVVDEEACNEHDETVEDDGEGQEEPPEVSDSGSS